MKNADVVVCAGWFPSIGLALRVFWFEVAVAPGGHHVSELLAMILAAVRIGPSLRRRYDRCCMGTNDEHPILVRHS